MAREVIEVTPLVNKPTAAFHDNLVYKTVKNLALIALWYGLNSGKILRENVHRYFFSTTLSLLNKHLIGRGGVEGKGKFPAPLLMTGIQFAVQFVLCRLFLDLGLVDRAEKHEEIKTWTHYFRNGAEIWMGNLKLMCDVQWSQMVCRRDWISDFQICRSRQSVSAFTPCVNPPRRCSCCSLPFSGDSKGRPICQTFLTGDSSPSWSLCGIMMVITSGILLLVYGETKFNFVGFSLVMSASCLAGLRWTLTQLLLQGNNSSSKRIPILLTWPEIDF